MTGVARRALLGGVGGTVLLAPRIARGAVPVLRVGDQRGGAEALLPAAGVLTGLPYRIAWSQFPNAAPLLEAADAGAIDTGYVGDSPATFAFANGAAIRAIAARRSGQAGTAVVVARASPARDFASLGGRTLATSRGSIGHYLALALIARLPKGASAPRVLFLQPSDAHAALLSGSVDAWATWEPYTSQVELVDGGRRVADGDGVVPGIGYQVASTGVLGTRDALLADYLGRLARARVWANAHVDAYAARWSALIALPQAVPRQWFGRAREVVVPIDDAVRTGEQSVVDLLASDGLIRRFEAAAMLDARFNGAVARANG